MVFSDAERSNPPEKIPATLTFFEHCVCVLNSVQFIVCVDAQVLIFIHNVHCFPTDDDRVRMCTLFPKVHQQLLCLIGVELQVV